MSFDELKELEVEEFCAFMPDFKKDGITYDELCAALRRPEKVAEDMFDVFEMYRSIYECVWCQSNKHHIKKLIIYDAVISFFKYPEARRKQVKFFDFLIVEIMKKYVIGHKKRYVA